MPYQRNTIISVSDKIYISNRCSFYLHLKKMVGCWKKLALGSKNDKGDLIRRFERFK